MRYLTSVTTVVAAVACVLATPAPATAEVRVVGDEVGDAPARYDIVQVRVDNTEDRVVVRTYVRDLRATGTQDHGVTVGTSRGSSFAVTVVRRPGGDVAVGTLGVGSRTDCLRRLMWSTSKDTITTVLNRDCFGAGPLLVSTSMGAADNLAEDPIDGIARIRVRQG